MNITAPATPLRTLSYGALPDQVGDLYLPAGAILPVIVLLHGGFWRMPWGRDHIAPVARDLARRGWAVWNLEYRRVGAGGGWPQTLEDVTAGIDHLAGLADAGYGLDLTRVTVVGHSAGGHLALWSAGTRSRVRIAAAVGLAAVADLAFAHTLDAGNGAVADFMGGAPGAFPERYRDASPAQRLPCGTRQLLLHGTWDEDVPVGISRRYARAAEAAGDAVEYIELGQARHMDFVDPASSAHAELCDWLVRRTGDRHCNRPGKIA